MTPHIEASPGDFAKTVLMPGDPKRSRFIAENYLSDAHLVNDLRGVQGYTGIYKGSPVSVMASGMGIPSISIYSHELYTIYGVENIIRVGSAGALRKDLSLGSVVAAMGACTDSNVASLFSLGASFAPIADYTLLSTAVARADALGVPLYVGNIYCSDLFYDATERNLRFAELGVLAVEMETAGLYISAARTGKRAIAICSVSDNVITGEAMSGEARVTAFDDMIRIALETAHALNENK